jgi:hypothetical protein
VLDAARTARAVRADLSALEFILAIGMITRPQPEAVRVAAPELVPRLVSIMLAGMGTVRKTVDPGWPDTPSSVLGGKDRP